MVSRNLYLNHMSFFSPPLSGINISKIAKKKAITLGCVSARFDLTANGRRQRSAHEDPVSPGIFFFPVFAFVFLQYLCFLNRLNKTDIRRDSAARERERAAGLYVALGTLFIGCRNMPPPERGEKIQRRRINMFIT